MPRPTLRAARALLASLAIALAAACSEPLGPTALVGEYEDRAFTSVVERAGNLVFEGLSATLMVESGGTLTRRTVYRETNVDTQQSVIRDYTQPMTYVVEGTRLRTSMLPCPVNMACAAVLVPTPDFLIVDGGAALVALDGRGGRYGRVAGQAE
jgi:hypothetical protein